MGPQLGQIHPEVEGTHSEGQSHPELVGTHSVGQSHPVVGQIQVELNVKIYHSFMIQFKIQLYF